MKKDYWYNQHAKYKEEDWIDKPSIFAEFVIKYFPKSGRILELGAGQGQDSRYFAQHGYYVVSTDNNPVALKESLEKLEKQKIDNIKLENVSLGHELTFKDAEFDVVYAHLSLHYFDDDTTKAIFNEINRVLKEDGILAFFTNSTSDPEYKSGTMLENDLYEIEGKKKRFFTVKSAKKYAVSFTPILVDNNGETYKDNAKGVHNLIRFIGKKE
ncbi:MAG TPA: class I SAM-dependent methyltransferase [Candidatus Saccharibacteria bacterium]|nr:class I SAM-dependent methyltransferase [Candidatus Saccharibacteria bacterium]HMT39768.1 class I SAM-dependent methyltransferase [Candidatus Saccharibacteria bacterium]